MNKKLLVGCIIIIAIFFVLGFLLVAKEDKQSSLNQNKDVNSEVSSNETIKTENTAATLPKGRYQEYSEASRADSSYKRTLLFFHAPWCPQCRAFEKNITAATIPEGTQILKVDYDSNTQLKKQYGVTLQTTFVQVDTTGSLTKKWVGYTSNHSLESLLEQFPS